MTTHAPIVVSLGDVAPEPVRWLWPGRIALGKLTLLCGDPGLGKSFATLDLAARVSTGAEWPDGAPAVAGPGGVVLLSAEDDLADTIRPRLDAAGANVHRIVALKAVRRFDPDSGAELTDPFCLTTDLDTLEQAIVECDDCRLAIIDPISAYLGGGLDTHNNADVRRTLAPLSDLAARHGVSILAVTHLNKGAGGQAIYRATGSLAFVAAARAVYAVAKADDDPARRLFLPIKANLGNDSGGLAYRIEGDGQAARVEWEPEPVNVTADEAFGVGAGDDDSGALREAMDWLRDRLGPSAVPASEVKADAQRDGIASRTLDRAKSRLKVESRRRGFGGPWVWELPDVT